MSFPPHTHTHFPPPYYSFLGMIGGMKGGVDPRKVYLISVAFTFVALWGGSFVVFAGSFFFVSVHHAIPISSWVRIWDLVTVFHVLTILDSLHICFKLVDGPIFSALMLWLGRLFTLLVPIAILSMHDDLTFVLSPFATLLGLAWSASNVVQYLGLLLAWSRDAGRLPAVTLLFFRAILILLSGLSLTGELAAWIYAAHTFDQIPLPILQEYVSPTTLITLVSIIPPVLSFYTVFGVYSIVHSILFQFLAFMEKANVSHPSLGRALVTRGAIPMVPLSTDRQALPRSQEENE